MKETQNLTEVLKNVLDYLITSAMANALRDKINEAVSDKLYMDAASYRDKLSEITANQPTIETLRSWRKQLDQ